MLLKHYFKNDEFTAQHRKHFFKIGVDKHTTASQSNTLRGCVRTTIYDFQSFKLKIYLMLSS
jgi:hypothetical protein